MEACPEGMEKGGEGEELSPSVHHEHVSQVEEEAKVITTCLQNEEEK